MILVKLVFWSLCFWTDVRRVMKPTAVARPGVPGQLRLLPVKPNPAEQKPRMSRIPRMGNRCLTAGSSAHTHLPDERSFSPSLFVIRAIRVIRGFICFFHGGPRSRRSESAHVNREESQRRLTSAATGLRSGFADHCIVRLGVRVSISQNTTPAMTQRMPNQPQSGMPVTSGKRSLPSAATFWMCASTQVKLNA